MIPYNALRALAVVYYQDPNTAVLEDDFKVILEFISYIESRQTKGEIE